jgi:hypothetical protein
MMKRSQLAAVVALAVGLAVTALGQTKGETKSQVPELTEFHSTIYTLWHTGWPEKDISLLQSLVPDIEKGYKSLVDAKLPGILREKSTQWEAGLKKFGDVVARYKSAASARDSVALLNAAEEVHSAYESLVRTIRPVLKELDNFHQTLYVLYHYSLPEYKFEEIKKGVEEMKPKMEALMKAQLPERLKERGAEFDKARKGLDESLKELDTTLLQGSEKEKVVKAVERLHARYQVVEKVFE